MAKEFLQSNEWRKFQESVGRKTFHLSGENFLANIIEHELPIVGKYFYIPKGPGTPSQSIEKIINLAKENKIGWIRIEPETEEILEIIKNTVGADLVSAPHNVQPREIFVIDIAKSEEELLAEMKSKTRYNIRLAEKKKIKIFIDKNDKHIEEFLRLTAVMAKRQGIVAHPENYYRKMLEVIPGDILKLYVAEYRGEVIAANLVVCYGETCIYLHGASDDNFRNVMAPYLLQWQQIRDAKKAGCVRYDFGGVSIDKWQGITKFKTGFSSKTLPTIFPGSYDIILNNKKYWAYRLLQKLKNIF